MTRWLVTGAGGMLGTDLVAALASRGEPVTGMDRASLDVTDAAAVTDAIGRGQPDVVVNCAAWTAVDDAEAAEEQASAVNAGGAVNLAASCAALGARLVQVSTDYVFAGDAGRPYAEDDVPDDDAEPSDEHEVTASAEDGLAESHDGELAKSDKDNVF